jgi:hypothetical protein
MFIRSILRAQYSSNTNNNLVKRLFRTMDTIRNMQFESSVSIVNNEFNRQDSSTPKRAVSSSLVETFDDESLINNLENQVSEEFDDNDDTIQPGQSSPSDQSLSSFRSAYSTIETYPSTSPDKSTLIETQ